MRPKRVRKSETEENPFPPWISILYDKDESITTTETEPLFARKKLRQTDDNCFVETKDHRGWWRGKVVAEGGKKKILNDFH